MKIWRPYTQMKSPSSAILLEYAKGAYLYSQDGRKIFDGISSWWLITHGHAQPEIAEAIGRQAKLLEQSVFANFTHEPAEELCDLLGEFLPKELCHCFFSDNGSTAIEVAMKMAYQYAAQSGYPEKTRFVAFKNSYHGDTCGAMSVSGDSSFTKHYNGMRFEILRAGQGHSVHDPLEMWVDSFEKLMDAKGREVCAVLLEPLIQGAGGMIVWPVEAVQKIYDIAKNHGALVIFDEVMTGFGRTGTMFAFEQTNRTPDIICLSKGLTGGFLPLGLTLTNQLTYDAFLDSEPDKMLFHGHSFTGNAISCAAASANLRIFKNLNLPKTASLIRGAHIAGIGRLSGKIPLREQRICGTIGIIELNSESAYGSEFSRAIHENVLALNIFIRPLGNTIYLMPPYCATSAEIELAWENIGTAIEFV